MADSWLGTSDSLSLKQLANEQINSQSQPCCLTSRPLPLQDNCLDCALCLRECLYQWANRTGEAWEARKSHGPIAWQQSHQPPFRKPWVRSLTDGRKHWSPSLNRSLPSLKRKLQTSACFTHGMLNIDHGELNPRSLEEKERQSQVERWRGKKGVCTFSERPEHSTTGGQPSEDRKSAPLLTCQPKNFLQDSTRDPVQLSAPTSLMTQHAKHPWSDTIPSQPLVTPQSSSLITSCTAQSMTQGQYNMASPGVSNRIIDHSPEASHWLFLHVYNKSPRLSMDTQVKPVMCFS